jgi:hypothetical protein
MSNVERAREHAANAERLLSKINLEDMNRRQGFNEREANTATVADAFATLALSYRDLPDTE